MVEVLQLETPSLGDRSYLIHDGAVALVVDPQRDIDRMLALADEHGVRITHIAETHVHNDYLTGGLALSRATGATYLVNEDDPVRFPRTPLRDGDSIGVSDAIRVRVLATPGHTFTHLSYVLETDGTVSGVFTGGSLLYGATGRPDLLGPENTAALAQAQYASAQRLAGELPDATEVFPTHGFGSFCAAGQGPGSHSSTIGHEKLVNPALTLRQETYLDTLLAGLDAWPAYYAHMGPANLAGPGGPDLSPPRRAGAQEIRRRIDAGEWVIDLRDRVAFAAGFVPGTVSFTLDNSFVSYAGWAVPWGAPITLLGVTPDQVAQAQRELARIGFDRPAAAADGRPVDWAGGRPLSSFRLAKLGDLADRLTRQPAGLVVLDVRRRLEWAEGHITGATHIPFTDLLGRLDDVPPGEVWVHCQSGYRAAVAASVLAAHGRQVVSVNDDFSNAPAVGLPLERG
jgi:glyoxylase-like metal-dependent hydrolase (beta-lactamase superfamily II)/rhodanese-related sulfurtransferase